MKKIRSLMAAFLAGTMTISMAAPTLAADGQLTQTFQFEKPALLEDAGDSSQITSKPETVYVNKVSADSRSINFNENWRFFLGEQNGAESVTYNDSTWRNLNLPHDYSIEQDYTQTGEAESGYKPGGTGWYRKTFSLTPDMAAKKLFIEFDGAYMNATVWINGKQLGTHPYGYTSFAFELPKDALNFTGQNVLAVRTAHKLPSSRWYSGSGIYRDVHLTITEPVHVARHGVAITTPDLKDNQSSPTVAISTVVQNETDADATVTLTHTITKKDSTASVATVTTEEAAVAQAGKSTIESNVTVNNPTLWQAGTGGLYTVRTEVKVNGALTDTVENDFGFRYFRFDRDSGFYLNGDPLKLKGVCMHHDQGALGSEAWYRAIERQVERLQDMGCNAIRVTHNPAADILLDICNEKGMLVIDESFDTWTGSKNSNGNDYGSWFSKVIEEGNTIIGGAPGTMQWHEYDTKEMVQRGKNAPSIIMWSLGNELSNGGSGHERYPGFATQMSNWIREIDPERPTTFGDDQLKFAGDGSAMVGIAKALSALEPVQGIVGFNYSSIAQTKNKFDTYDNWIVYGAETASSVNSRGVYDRGGSDGSPSDMGKGDRLLTAYDKSSVGWGALASEAWYDVITQDYNAGEFVWTGFDYIGEPTPWNGVGTGSIGAWPAPKSSYFGIIDTAGFAKDSFYFYQSQWNNNVNTLHVLPTWNEDEIMQDDSGNVEVVVYSDAAKVKLEHIDAAGKATDLGTKEFTEVKTGAGYIYQMYEGEDKNTTAHKNLYLTWNVPYAPGTIKATAYDKNNNIISNTEGRSSVTTTGDGAKLSAKADRTSIAADGKDLSYITIDALDSADRFVNGAEPEISLDIQGDGVILGVDNGSQIDHTSYQSTTRSAFRGKLLAIVQSTKKGGSFTLSASAPGYAGTKVTVTTNAVGGGETQNALHSYDIVRNYYIQTGGTAILPTTVEAVYSDGTNTTLDIKWDTLPDYNTPGVYTVTGTIDQDVKVSVTVTVMDAIAALLNYSSAVSIGNQIVLPSARPAVTVDGSIVEAEFPVIWEEIPADAGNKEGIITVKGAATVFNKAYSVNATVRVAPETVKYGDNMTYRAEYFNAAVNEELLSQIYDGNKDDGNGWIGSGDVTLIYNTAQNMGKANLYFEGDAPEDGDVTFSWSPNGVEWHKIVTKGETKTEGDKTYQQYIFNLVPAVQFRMHFNKEVKLKEAELIIGQSEFKLGTSDELTSMTVNEQPVSQTALKAREVDLEAYFVRTFDAKSDYNASFTQIPIYEDVVRILTESEDHQKRGQYSINLRKEATAEDPTDDSNDYDYTKTKATAPSEELVKGGEKEGPAAYAVDGKTGTFWHTEWGADLSTTPEKRYIQLALEEATPLVALRHLGRSNDNQNGFIKGYRVETSMDETNWETVSEGTWSMASGWKRAEFTKEVIAKYVRLYGVNTHSDTKQDALASAVELRVCTAAVKTDISDAPVTINGTYMYTGEPIKPVPVVTYNGSPLMYGVDYTVEYTDNIDPGTATVTVKGIGYYSGGSSATFTIGGTGGVVQSYYPIEITTVTEKAPTLPEKVKAKMSVGVDREFTVVWNEILPASYANAGKFLVEGTVEKQTAKPVASITVLGIASAEKISVTTGKGAQPKLPEKIMVYFTDGTAKECPVTWEEAVVDAVANVTVKGIAKLDDSETPTTYEVTANVNVIDGAITGNLALKVAESKMPLALTDFANDDVPGHVTDGNKPPSTAGTGDKAIWGDWERDTYHEAPWVGVVLGTGDSMAQTKVNKVSLYFFDESGKASTDMSGTAVRVPQSYKIQYYNQDADFAIGDKTQLVRSWKADGTIAGEGEAANHPLNIDANWTDVTVVDGGDYPAVPNDTNYYKDKVDVYFDTVDTRMLRVVMTPYENQWTGLSELEIYQEDMKQSTDFEVQTITVDGEDKLAAFVDNKLEIPVTKETVPVVAATATNNAVISIIQASSRSGVATVMFTPEDGNKEKRQTYTIQFTTDGEAVTAMPIEHATITVPEKVNPGDITRIDVQPEAGYQVKAGSLKAYKTGEPTTAVTLTGEYFVMPDHPVTVTAETEAITYSIYYDLRGGTVSTENPATYTIETESITLVNPTKTNDTFAGWMGTGLETRKENIVIAKGSTGNRNYIAQWNSDADPSKQTIGGTVSITGTPKAGEVLTLDVSQMTPSYATGTVTWIAGDTVVAKTVTSTTQEEYSYEIRRNLVDQTSTGEELLYYVEKPNERALVHTYRVQKSDVGKTLTATFIADGYFKGQLSATKEIPKTAPEAPIVTVLPGNQKIMLTWEAPFDGGEPITEYIITVKGAPNSPYTIPASTGYTITGLENNKEYEVSVVAKNNIGASAASTPTKVTPKAGTFTVTFNANGGEPVAPIIAEENTTITLPSAVRSGYKLLGWFTEAEGGTEFTNSIPITEDITLYAQWKKTSSSGGGGGGGGGSTTTDKPSGGTTQPGEPVLGETKPVKPDASGNVSVDNNMIKDAIAQAKKDAIKDNKEKDGIAITVPITTEAGQVTLQVAIDAKSIESLLKENVKSFDMVAANVITVSLDKGALEQIKQQAKGGNISLEIEKQTSLSAQAMQVIGTRPVFDIKLVYTQDDNKLFISDFKNNKVTIKLPYVPAANEKAEDLRAVYVDDDGNVSWIEDSGYDKDSKSVTFKTNHFSIYGIAQKEETAPPQPTTAFNDISGHWAKGDIEYVAQKGLLSGTAANTFSPDISMTRGMFVTALGRLAGAEVGAYTSSSFADVTNDAYYMGYIEWASSKGIVKGTGNGEFAPDQPVTRQEMAAIMANYAKAMGHTTAQTQPATAFADDAAIADWAKGAVQAMQMAGVINGKGDNLFVPNGTATRAEVAAVLHRFVEGVR